MDSFINSFQYRSLGVHISFVRSIAMDSWTPLQLKIMKAGGNDACNSFLQARGVSKNATIQEKYNSDAAALYKEVIKARAEGRPEPTSLPPPKPRSTTNISGSAKPSSSSITSSYHHNGLRSAPTSSGPTRGSSDPNGMERLAGESEDEYIARQTRLREEAKARMAAKFGTSGGKMGGVGSSPHPGSYNSSGSFNMESIADTLSAGLGSAFSIAKQGMSSVQSSTVTKDVTSAGYGLWSTFKSGMTEVASVAQTALSDVLTTEKNDGLLSLNEQMRREREARGASSNHSGFGSSDPFGSYSGRQTNTTNGSNANSSSFASELSSSGYASSTSSVGLSSSDQNSIAPLEGESNEDYMQRQMKIHQNSSSSLKHSLSSTLKKPASTATKMKVDEDDFFSSFGA